MAITVIREEKPYRLISDGNDHYAVIEARCGHVYPVLCDDEHHRKTALDTPGGMELIARDRWNDRDTATRCFQYMVENEERYAQIIW